ncbi:MAG: site-specific integrase [Sphingobacteriaceae bacterium]|nr:MAG: site-specific integrase [Sphingobacteriaceae bacterium]
MNNWFGASRFIIGRVTGSNPVTPTQTGKDPDKQQTSCESGFFYVKSLPNSLDCPTENFADMGRILPYSIPVIKKGKTIKTIPKGSTKLHEQAKQLWHIEFFFFNEATGKNERLRITNGLNRIKDPKEKLKQFEALQLAYKELLETGYNPLDEKQNEKLKKSIVSITIIEAVEKFKEYHISKRTRPTTIRSYLSKIKQFITHVGPSKKVIDISDYDITDYLNTYEASEKWTGVTYNYGKTSLNNLFKFLLVNKYVTTNPVLNLERRKEVRTEIHQVFSEDDFKLIMQWLRANDRYCLLFAQMLYYTCIRPKELRETRLSFIDLKNNKITIPAHISKNRKAIPVKIDVSLKPLLENLNLSQYPSDYYLFGDPKSIIGKDQIGENTPYNKFQACLNALNLKGKNYTLYSFKHLSNVNKYLAGWQIAEICAANRHSSLVETETYLKDLMKFIPVTKDIPPI